MTLEDILRAIVLAEIIITFFFAVAILYHYTRRRVNENRIKTNLTWHVITMLFVFLGICGYLFADILVRFGTPLTWRSPVLIPMLAGAIAGEYFMFRYQVRRGTLSKDRQK